MAPEERASRNVEDAHDGGDLCWTEACEGIVKKILKYFENSEVIKGSTRELKGQILSPDESSVNMVRIARQARNVKKPKVVSDFQTRSERGPHR